jgi:membrane protein DedA with SNARE-associated domain
LSEHIALWATEAMSWFGYAGLAFLMALESMVAPVPSELVMPFAGFLVDQGRFTMLGGILASSLGTFVGSLIGYYMGKFGGYPVVTHFGRFLLLDRGHLEMTARWFERRGELTVFISRFIPVVRHFISIPAGVAKMNLVRFCGFTLLGGTMWNTFLLLVGIRLNKRWEIVHHYSREIDMVVMVIIGIVGVWWVRKQLQRRKSRSAQTP